MKFEDALELYRSGHNIRRSTWLPGFWVGKDTPAHRDWDETDWEMATDNPYVLTYRWVVKVGDTILVTDGQYSEEEALKTPGLTIIGKLADSCKVQYVETEEDEATDV